MSLLHIYDQHGQHLRSITDVIGHQLDPYGVLVVDHIRDDNHPGRILINPRTWGTIEEILYADPSDPAPEAPAGLLGELRESLRPADPLAVPNALRLREAMSIVCICDAIRCGAVDGGDAPAFPLPPKLVDDADGPVLTRGDGDGPADAMAGAEVLPVRRCRLDVRHLAHADTQEHVYDGPPWPYGTGNHHPRCPRHPDVYNAHTGPCGAPYIEGGRPVPGMTCMLPYGHDGDHATSPRAMVASVGISEAVIAAARGRAPVPARPDDGSFPHPSGEGWFHDRFAQGEQEPNDRYGPGMASAEAYATAEGHPVGNGRHCPSELTGNGYPDGTRCDLVPGHDGDHQAANGLTWP